MAWFPLDIWTLVNISMRLSSLWGGRISTVFAQPSQSRAANHLCWMFSKILGSTLISTKHCHFCLALLPGITFLQRKWLSPIMIYSDSIIHCLSFFGSTLLLSQVSMPFSDTRACGLKHLRFCASPSPSMPGTSDNEKAAEQLKQVRSWPYKLGCRIWELFKNHNQQDIMFLIVWSLDLFPYKVCIGKYPGSRMCFVIWRMQSKWLSQSDKRVGGLSLPGHVITSFSSCSFIWQTTMLNLRKLTSAINLW